MMSSNNSLEKNKLDKEAERNEKMGDDDDSENYLRLLILKIDF